MGNVITILICAVLIATLTFALIKGIWSAAKKITVPIQVVLFVVILVCVGRMLFTKENAHKLYDGIEQSGISQNMERTMRSALNMKQVPETKALPAAVPQKDEEIAKAAMPPQQPRDAGKNASPAVKAESPTAVNVAAEVKHAPQGVAVSNTEPIPMPAQNYSHFDKGKMSFVYALPFNAKVTVGFKDATYRVIVDSLGRLEASDKKEVGKMIVKALGEYTGAKIASLDKSKISIEPRYDEADNRTRVYAVIPPEAIE